MEAPPGQGIVLVLERMTIIECSYRCRHKSDDAAWPRRKGGTPLCDSARYPHTPCCQLRFQEADIRCCFLRGRRKVRNNLKKVLSNNKKLRPARSSCVCVTPAEGTHLCRRTCPYRWH